MNEISYQEAEKRYQALSPEYQYVIGILGVMCAYRYIQFFREIISKALGGFL